MSCCLTTKKGSPRKHLATIACHVVPPVYPKATDADVAHAAGLLEECAIDSKDLLTIMLAVVK